LGAKSRIHDMTALNVAAVERMGGLSFVDSYRHATRVAGLSLDPSHLTGIEVRSENTMSDKRPVRRDLSCLKSFHSLLGQSNGLYRAIDVRLEREACEIGAGERHFCDLFAVNDVLASLSVVTHCGSTAAFVEVAIAALGGDISTEDATEQPGRREHVE